jgi:GntR family transcriptional regulator/MocR family aminotransferase
MGRWELVLDPSESPSENLFSRIAREVVAEIRRGRLRPGDRLPGSRTLATSLGVHRNTVLAAYQELIAEGWLTAERARGVFVSPALPDPKPRRLTPLDHAPAQLAARPGYDLQPPTGNALSVWPSRAPLPLAGGLPDLRLAPFSALARAYRRVILRHGRALLDYGDPRGALRLRAALASMLSTARGLAAGPEEIVVTRGSQMALYLVAHALCGPGDLVAVEALGYRPAWEAFGRTGPRLVPIPVDAQGIRVDALAELVAREKIRAVYVTPHHHYPTTVTLTAPRRLALLELARAHRFAIVEDDYDHEFHYQGRPVLPLASADRAGVVVYLGTLSKVLAPGLRLGYVVAPRPMLDRIAAHRVLVDRQGDAAVESAVAELLEEGEVQRHVRRARRIYQARRDALTDALTARLGRVLEFQSPTGGIGLWATVDPAVDVERWVERAAERGVVFQPGRRFTFDGRALPNARLGFAALDEDELSEAVRLLSSALPAARARPLVGGLHRR